MLAIVIPAAGASSRMRGSDKLMQDVRGVPALRHTAVAALDVTPHVLVSLPPNPDHPRFDALEGLEISRIQVPRPTEGMGASLAALAQALPPEIKAVMITMPDMPDIGASEMSALASHYDPKDPNQIVQATTGNGLPGHPTLFGSAHFPALCQLKGDRGAYRLLQDHGPQVKAVPLPGAIARRDLDTPEDWAAWRKAQ